MSENSQTMIAASTVAEPKAGGAPVPVWLIVLIFALLYWSAIAFDRYSGWFDRQVYPPYQSADHLAMFQPAPSGAAMALARGRQVYESVCALCHGVDGMGKPNQAPPFAGSEWVLDENVNRVLRIPLAGLTGPVKVKGKEWSLSMPAMGASLPDEDLAAVVTYIRSSWGNNASAVSSAQVKAVRAAIAGRSQPWTAEELQKVQ